MRHPDGNVHREVVSSDVGDGGLGRPQHGDEI